MSAGTSAAVFNLMKSCLADGYPFVFTVYFAFEGLEVAKTGLEPPPARRLARSRKPRLPWRDNPHSVCREFQLEERGPRLR